MNNQESSFTILTGEAVCRLLGKGRGAGLQKRVGRGRGLSIGG